MTRTQKDNVREAKFVNEFCIREGSYYNNNPDRCLTYALHQYDIVVRRGIKDHRASDVALIMLSEGY